MSWLFSQALVEEYLPVNQWDGEQFAQLNVMPTLHKFSRNDKMIDFSKLSRYGLTLNLLTEQLGKDLLTLYQQAFLVKTSHQQGNEEVLKEINQDYGEKFEELPMKYDLNTSSWKTQGCLFQEDLQWSSVTLPRWGMMQSGKLYTLPKWAQSTYDREHGYLPTPTAHNAKEGAYPAEYTRNTPSLATHAGGKINPEWTEWLMGWPTGWTDLKPLAMDKFRNVPKKRLKD